MGRSPPLLLSLPALTATPINQISYLRLSGDDCALKSATMAVSSPATRKEMPGAPSLQGGQKLEDQWDGMLKTASPCLPFCSWLQQAIMRMRAELFL